jgi:glycosyltransferase involved in cell wall biosynthesis
MTIAERSLKISIVTPSFQQGVFIAEAIESVVAQGYANFEHIIVDNCSTDQTSEVLAKYPHLKVIREPDEGQSDALNKGFRAATGDIVGWLNADDKYLPGCFVHVLKAFAGRPDCEIIYGDYRFVDAHGGLIRVRKELPFDMFMLKYLHVLYIPTTSTFFRRTVFDNGNFLDIRYHYAMDYEFFVRLALKGSRFGHIPQILADFRWHTDSKSQTQTARQKEEMERALLAHDDVLRGVPGPVRMALRGLLTATARAKRIVLKLLRGAYSA